MERPVTPIGPRTRVVERDRTGAVQSPHALLRLKAALNRPERGPRRLQCEGLVLWRPSAATAAVGGSRPARRRTAVRRGVAEVMLRNRNTLCHAEKRDGSDQ